MAIHSSNKKILIAVFVVLLLLGAAYLFYPRGEVHAPTETPNHEPYRTTLTGIHVCLPHKDTSGPQTLECALGMQTDNGDYYALDFTMLSQGVPNIPTGRRFQATGLVTPVEWLSSDHWQKYDIKGIFSVTDSLQEL